MEQSKNNKTVAFLTLGCKVNSYETDAMEQIFINDGYKIADFNSVADVYVINTCSVTNMADRKSRQMIHKARKNNANGLVVAVGCYVQTATKEALEDMAVDIVIGNNRKKDILNIIDDYRLDKNNRKAVIAIENDNEFEEMSIVATSENTRAYIKIQDGCNQFCSYCIIPYARGRIRSRKKEDIYKEVENLAKAGYKEVVLTGIHLSSYGMDWQKDNKKIFRYEPLLEVINEISKNDVIKRIRLGSLEPRIISDEFIEKLSKNKKVCPHFHLSLQSGCDDTLRRMNRKYTVDMFFEKCEIIRKYYNNPALTTDIIVGFPGETNEEFEITKEFLEKVNFSMIHVFKYSKRRGTVAAKMDNQVSEEIKTIRSKILLEMTKRQHLEYMSLFCNTKQTVLFEETIKINGKEYAIGHNEAYVKFALEHNCSEDISNIIKEVEVVQNINDEIMLVK